MLKIALSKGVLFGPSIKLLKKSGFDTKELADPGRRLVIDSSDNIRYIIARPADVPTYVEYGAADVGIAGKDALIESETDVFELLDLKIGKCTFVLAEPYKSQISNVKSQISNVKSQILNKKISNSKTSMDYQRLGQLRVATKYPKIAGDYLNKKGIQAEIITLRGSVELAPVTGLADMIIDLTTTGKTLAENGLKVVDEIIECSARVIANMVSMRLRHDEINKFIERLRK